MYSKKNWFFADGYLPEKINNGPMEAHEALMLFNPSSMPVEVRLHIYFSDRAPFRNLALRVEADRVLTVRLDHPDELGGTVIPPLTQYALHVEADAPLVCQFGRLDTTQNAMGYYTGVGYSE